MVALQVFLICYGKETTTENGCYLGWLKWYYRASAYVNIFSNAFTQIEHDKKNTIPVEILSKA